MNKALLDQTCDVLTESSLPQNQWNPDVPANDLVVLIPNVPCSLDTAVMSAMRRQVLPGTTEKTIGGMLMIDGDYGEGDQRQFSEKNAIRVAGFVWNVGAIHDIHGISSLDHYEIEVSRRAVGGAR